MPGRASDRTIVLGRALVGYGSGALVPVAALSPGALSPARKRVLFPRQPDRVSLHHARSRRRKTRTSLQKEGPTVGAPPRPRDTPATPAPAPDSPIPPYGPDCSLIGPIPCPAPLAPVSLLDKRARDIATTANATPAASVWPRPPPPSIMTDRATESPRVRCVSGRGEGGGMTPRS